MKSNLFAAKALLLGLIVAQIVASIFVYRSNINLHEKLTALEAAHYLIVPNQYIKPSLLKISTAVCGGIFFSLSIGAGLSVISLIFAWIWVRFLNRRKKVLGVGCLLWAGFGIFINIHGINPLFTWLTLTVPPAVFWVVTSRIPEPARLRAWAPRLGFIIPLIIVISAWSTQADRQVALDVRDYLLWSNPVGRAISDFYYRYTLYPAEAFKSLNQKLMNTSNRCELDDPKLTERLERALLRNDYLPLDRKGPYDLKIVVQGDSLILKQNGRRIMEKKVKDFLFNPSVTLRKFSELSDRNKMLRQASHFSMLIGTPLMGYILVFSLLQGIIGLGLKSGPAAAIAGLVCLGLGMSILSPIYVGRSASEKNSDVAELLRSDRCRIRVAGLRLIVERKLDITTFSDYQRDTESLCLPERYWLAHALGYTRDKTVQAEIMKLLDDPVLNVACMAFYSLGLRRDKTVIPEILNRIEAGRHWYSQWYAYRALRQLGWTQTDSN